MTFVVAEISTTVQWLILLGNYFHISLVFCLVFSVLSGFFWSSVFVQDFVHRMSKKKISERFTGLRRKGIFYVFIVLLNTYDLATDVVYAMTWGSEYFVTCTVGSCSVASGSLFPQTGSTDACYYSTPLTPAVAVRDPPFLLSVMAALNSSCSCPAYSSGYQPSSCTIYACGPVSPFFDTSSGCNTYGVRRVTKDLISALLIILLSKEGLRMLCIFFSFFFTVFDKPNVVAFYVTSPLLLPIFVCDKFRYRKCLDQFRQAKFRNHIVDYLLEDLPQLGVNIVTLFFISGWNNASAIAVFSLAGSLVSVGILTYRFFRGIWRQWKETKTHRESMVVSQSPVEIMSIEDKKRDSAHAIDLHALDQRYVPAEKWSFMDQRLRKVEERLKLIDSCNVVDV